MALGDLSYEQGPIVGARIDDSGQVELRGARMATPGWAQESTTDPAPKATAASAASCPMGPPPVTSTASPGRNGALETADRDRRWLDECLG